MGASRKIVGGDNTKNGIDSPVSRVKHACEDAETPNPEIQKKKRLALKPEVYPTDGHDVAMYAASEDEMAVSDAKRPGTAVWRCRFWSSLLLHFYCCPAQFTGPCYNQRNDVLDTPWSQGVNPTPPRHMPSFFSLEAYIQHSYCSPIFEFRVCDEQHNYYCQCAHYAPNSVCEKRSILEALLL